MPARLFVAIEFPDDVCAALMAARDKLRALLPRGSASFPHPEVLHLTVCFLGHVQEEAIGPLAQALDAAYERVPLMRLALANVGAFPTWDRPRVVWVGLTGDLGPLGALRARLARAATPFAHDLDTKPFHPHVTLARLKSPLADAIRLGAENLKVVQHEFVADKAVLFRSHRASSRASYEALARWRLT